jgi:hypothetical protein
MFIKNLFLSVLVLGCFANLQATELKIKDGRQYYIELMERLEIPAQEVAPLFKDLRQNLAKDHSQSSLVSGVEGKAKFATSACTFLSYALDNGTDIGEIYRLVLDRDPNPAERAQAILDEDGLTAIFPNCFMLTLHPEFILLTNGGRK